MSLFRIYREADDQVFADTGDVFDDGGDPAALGQHMAELQAGDGVCRSAMLVVDPAAPVAAELPPCGDEG